MMRSFLFSFFLLFLISNKVTSQQYYSNNIFGFATSNTFTFFDVNEKKFIEKVNKISPKVLRFPGGAVGNFYHYNGPAYGMNINEIDSLITGKFPKRARGLISFSKKKGHRQNYIYDFIKLTKATNSSAVIVVNVLTESNKDILQMIQTIVDNNVDVVGIELGSEMSNKSYFDKGYTIENYLNKSKEISEIIKEKFPNLKTAVVAAPLIKNKLHRHNIWNHKLSNENFYDAIIIHSYAKVVKGKDQYGQMIIEENEGDKDRAFTIYENRIQSFFEDSYPKEIDEYNAIFDKKPIWITEWNLQYSKKTGNTLFQGLFVANFFLELISNKRYEEIELTTFHNLAGRDFGGSVFQKKDNQTFIQSTYAPLQIVSKFFNEENLKVNRKKDENLHIYEFYKEDKLKYLCYINWSKKEKTIKYKKANMITQYGGKNLYDLNSEKNRIFFNKEKPNNSNVSILPYSITLIE